MASLADIITAIQIGLFVALILLALIYLIPILFIRRFHNVNNVFTANVCFAAIVTGIYWIFNLLARNVPSIYYSYSVVCFAMNYFQMVCTIQVPYAIIIVNIHRLCSVVYQTKPFFRKKKWTVICISSQWAAGAIFSFVQAVTANPTCTSPHWLQIYVFIVIVIIPSLVCVIINIIIFKYVRSSTNRVQPSSVGKNNDQQQCASRRDLHIIKHMIIMFCIFVGGWSPGYLYLIITRENGNPIVFAVIMICGELALLIDILDLYLYNHELRRYLIKQIFKCG